MGGCGDLETFCNFYKESKELHDWRYSCAKDSNIIEDKIFLENSKRIVGLNNYRETFPGVLGKTSGAFVSYFSNFVPSLISIYVIDSMIEVLGSS